MNFSLKQDGATPLIAACLNRRTEVVNVLVNSGVDVNIAMKVITPESVLFLHLVVATSAFLIVCVFL